MPPRLLLVLAVAALSGCFADAEGAFTDGRALEPCASTIPVCSATASCVLSDTNYTEGSFAQGATRRVIVRTTGEATIDVALYFVTEGSPGVDTEIAWSEVGCRDRASVSSDGKDLFAEAGADRVWHRSRKVTTAGDHLVEVFSDAQADYLLRVSVQNAQ
jgi:hypothetical protein